MGAISLVEKWDCSNLPELGGKAQLQYELAINCFSTTANKGVMMHTLHKGRQCPRL
jgi:hypothetical protein